MGPFSETVSAYLAGRQLRFAYLVEFQFDPAAYFWNGVGTLQAGGKTWVGLAQLGAIEGLSEALNGESQQMRLTLSGAQVSSAIMQAAASESRANYVGRIVTIWIQFFDEDWTLLDEPQALASGIVDGIPISREQGENGATIRTVTVTAENIFYSRRIPPNGYYTDSDQQQRFPGDLGMQFIPALVDKTISVPW